MLAFAQTPAVELKQILTNLHSLQAHFAQTVFDGNGRVLQQSSGLMTLQRPGLFRWETEQPAKQLLIADGSKVWFYDAELEQVTVQKQQTINANSPALLLSGTDQQLTEDFMVTRQMAANRNVQIFKLLPRANNNLFQSVQLVFWNQQLQKMRLIDSLGQATIINFSQVQTNPPLRAALFHFVIPRGVDVVNEG
jgi:outer membrane lipoprotein carrier protein